jgi:hypothetical protein
MLFEWMICYIPYIIFIIKLIIIFVRKQQFYQENTVFDWENQNSFLNWKICTSNFLGKTIFIEKRRKPTEKQGCLVGIHENYF